MLGSYAFSLQATIDHHGFSMYSGQYTASVYCYGKTSYCNDDKLTVCDINHTWGSSTTYAMIYKLFMEYVYRQNTEDVNYFLPWHQHILSISLNTDRGIGADTSWMDNVFPPDDLWFSSNI